MMPGFRKEFWRFCDGIGKNEALQNAKSRFKIRYPTPKTCKKTTFKICKKSEICKATFKICKKTIKICKIFRSGHLGYCLLKKVILTLPKIK